MKYKLSRYWNRVAYLIIKLGRRLIWDQTGMNRELLTDEWFSSPDVEAVMCGK